MHTSFQDPRLLLTQGDSQNYDDVHSAPDPSIRSERIKKIALALVGLTSLIATSSLTVIDLRDAPDLKRLSICLLLNGASLPLIVHPLVSTDLRKMIYGLSSDLSYPLLFSATQLYLNLVPERSLELAATGFIWWLGAYAAKDILHATSLTVSDFSLSTEPPSEELALVGISPRSKKGAVLILGALATSAAAGNVLYQVYKERLPSSLTDLQEIGFLQDLIALFSGGVIGEGIAHLSDNWKEREEAEHAQRLIVSNLLPTRLKVMRIAKTLFIIFVPSVCSALLAIPLPPNSAESYASKALVGGLVGAHHMFCRREFTHLQSTVHATHGAEGRVGLVSAAAKIKGWLKENWPALTLLGGLIGYMGWVATTTESPAIYGGITAMISSAAVGTGVTLLVKQRFVPGENSRVVNELAFRLLYSTMSFLIVYQYLTTVINIYADDLEKDSRSLYILALVAWCFWGFAMGNNLALIGQNKITPTSGTTDPLTMQELSKTLSLTLSRAQ